jgi:hypothetical protein
MDIVVTIPDGTRIDGAVVELGIPEDQRSWTGCDWDVTAEVRIPAPQEQPC